MESMGSPESHANKEHSSSQQRGIFHVGSENVPQKDECEQSLGPASACYRAPGWAQGGPRLLVASPEVPALMGPKQSWVRSAGQGTQRSASAAAI